MEFTNWAIVGIMCIVGGGSWFLGAAGGHYHGYRKGYEDAVRERDGIWKDRIATVTADVGKRMNAAYKAGQDDTALKAGYVGGYTYDAANDNVQ